ncbi:hypothetical protein F4781DRAFT_3569 [Annulohypoxylon bovei var. microspora]|nr:hypothetical protein F4781DRAFT_3569 [Annulohypoxylon bovei var. microspora]
MFSRKLTITAATTNSNIPPRVGSYKSMPSYRWYIDHSVRPANVPAFDIKVQTVLVPPGQVFCRMPISNDTLCSNIRKIIHPTNLRRHIQGHHTNSSQVKIPNGKLGALKVHENPEAVVY